MILSSSSSSSSSDEEYIVVRRCKIYRARVNHFNKWNDTDFFDRFRLTKPAVANLLVEIENLIRLPTNRGGCIQPINQLLLTLRFYATGNMLLAIGDLAGVSKASACRIVKRVTLAICSLRPRYISMYANEIEMAHTAEQFYRIARFPRVIGTIDCTHIRIQSPGGDDAEIFRNRKGYFSLNVQTVSDAQLKIRSIVARWPGSVHDQTIFNNSNLKRDFESGSFRKFLLLGDSGYSLHEYLMTPLQAVTTEAEQLYNEALIRTRNTVERQYGVWKRRFPILSIGMRVNLDTAMAIIVATAILHNIAVDMFDNLIQEANADGGCEIIEENDDRLLENHRPLRGRLIRQQLITEHFARL